MNAIGSQKRTEETGAQAILGIAKAISSHLELSDVLKSLIVQLKPMVHFDATAVVAVEGEYAKLHTLHIETPGPWTKPPENSRMEISNTPLGLVRETQQPYVCGDLETQRRFPKDEEFLKFGIRGCVPGSPPQPYLMRHCVDNDIRDELKGVCGIVCRVFGVIGPLESIAEIFVPCHQDVDAAVRIKDGEYLGSLS